MTPDVAPITQLMLTVQFAPPVTPPNPIQIADLYGPFREQFSLFEQIGRAGPMPTDPRTPVEISMFGMPRMQFSTPDRLWQILFQEDRFSYAWNRQSPLSEPSEYPGFQAVYDRASACWQVLTASLFREGGPNTALVGEIAYQDHIEVTAASGERPLSSVLKAFNPNWQPDLSAYNFAWTETPSSTSLLQVQLTGPMLNPQGVAVAQLSTIHRFRTLGSWDGLAAGFAAEHTVIADAFSQLINPNFYAI